MTDRPEPQQPQRRVVICHSCGDDLNGEMRNCGGGSSCPHDEPDNLERYPDADDVWSPGTTCTERIT